MSSSKYAALSPHRQSRGISITKLVSYLLVLLAALLLMLAAFVASDFSDFTRWLMLILGSIGFIVAMYKMATEV